jgi:hypothetical protein
MGSRLRGSDEREIGGTGVGRLEVAAFVSAVIARCSAEAIQDAVSANPALDCFAALAMTVGAIGRYETQRMIASTMASTRSPVPAPSVWKLVT